MRNGCVPCSPLFRGCLTLRERSSILTCEAPTLHLELRCANEQGVLEAHLASSRHLSEWHWAKESPRCA